MSEGAERGPGLAERPERPEQPEQGRRAPAWLLSVVKVLLPLATAVAVGVGLGLLSWHFWVLLLFPVALGASIGWAVAFSMFSLGVAATGEGARGDGRLVRRVPMVLLALCVVVGFTTEQVFEDHHQRRAFAESVFLTRAAGSGLDPAEIAALREASGTAFLARDADAELEAQISARLGVGGPLGRFVSRLEAGVRLGGPYVGGRGLELGLPGGILALCLELALALLIARRIARSALSVDAEKPSG